MQVSVEGPRWEGNIVASRIYFQVGISEEALEDRGLSLQSASNLSLIFSHSKYLFTFVHNFAFIFNVHFASSAPKPGSTPALMHNFTLAISQLGINIVD